MKNTKDQKPILTKTKKRKSRTHNNKRVKLGSLTAEQLEHELNVHRVELERQNEELLETQAVLSKTLEEYTEIFELAPVGYFILNEDGIIKAVNKTGTSCLGFSKKELTGKSFTGFIELEEELEEFVVKKSTALEKNTLQKIEIQVKRKNRSSVIALAEIKQVNDHNNLFKYLLLTLSDISLQREHEDALKVALNKQIELNELKTQFISVISHELRTPLATILTSAELMERYNKPEDQQKRKSHFDKIATSVKRLKEILIDFLSAEEFEKGLVRNSPEHFDLRDYIKQIVEEVHTFDGAHKIQYKHLGQSSRIYLDKKLLKICLSNLLINAYKYSPKDGRIEICIDHQRSGKLIISVKDSGIGIPKEDQVHIFSKFFRAGNVSNIRGTGLGLSLTKKIVQLMGGVISFTSEENRGTTFVMKFKKA